MTDRYSYSDLPPSEGEGGFLSFALKFALFGGVAFAALMLSSLLLPLAALALFGWLLWAGFGGAMVAGPGVRAVAFVVFAGILTALAFTLLPFLALGIAGYVGWRLLTGPRDGGAGHVARMDRESDDSHAFRYRTGTGRGSADFDRFMADRERRRYDIEGTAERL